MADIGGVSVTRLDVNWGRSYVDQWGFVHVCTVGRY